MLQELLGVWRDDLPGGPPHEDTAGSLTDCSMTVNLSMSDASAA